MLFRNGQSLMNTIVIPVTTSGDSEPTDINISTMTRKKNNSGSANITFTLQEPNKLKR